MQDWMFEAGPDPVPLEMTPLDVGVDAAWLALAAITTAPAEPWADPRFAAPADVGTAVSDQDLAWMFETDFLVPATTTASNGEAPMTDGLDPSFVPPMNDEEDPPYPIGDVVVIARNPNQNGGGWTPPPPPPPPPVDPTGPGAGEPAPSDPIAKQTECVETDFVFGADLEKVNNAALAASNAIGDLDDETFEYSSIIWMLNDTVGWTPPHTLGIPGEVNLLGGLASVPTGAIIVGIVHNHPDRGLINDKIPAPWDWDGYDIIVGRDGTPPKSLPRAIAADPNMLMYIKTNEDGKTRVYDNEDYKTQMPSCSID